MDKAICEVAPGIAPTTTTSGANVSETTRENKPLSGRKAKKDKHSDPMNVPISGKFFLHDDRFTEKQAGGKTPNGGRSKGGNSNPTRWKHDKFEQISKTDVLYSTGNSPATPSVNTAPSGGKSTKVIKERKISTLNEKEKKECDIADENGISTPLGKSHNTRSPRGSRTSSNHKNGNNNGKDEHPKKHSSRHKKGDLERENNDNKAADEKDKNSRDSKSAEKTGSPATPKKHNNKYNSKNSERSDGSQHEVVPAPPPPTSSAYARTATKADEDEDNASGMTPVKSIKISGDVRNLDGAKGKGPRPPGIPDLLLQHHQQQLQQHQQQLQQDRQNQQQQQEQLYQYMEAQAAAGFIQYVYVPQAQHGFHQYGPNVPPPIMTGGQQFYNFYTGMPGEMHQMHQNYNNND